MGLDYHKTIKDNKSKRVVGNIGGMTDASTRNAAQLTLNFQHLQKHFVLQKERTKISTLKKNRHIFFCCLSGPITFTYDGHGYFYSGDVEAHAEDKVDWLEARNICREYCMDLVSIETPSENDLIEELITGGEKVLPDDI